MKEDDESKRLLAETLDDILARPDPLEEMDKRSIIDMIVLDGMVMAIMFTLLTTTDVSLISLMMVFMLAIGSIYTYVREMKKKDAVIGKIYIDSTTYLDGTSFVEQDAIVGYEIIQNDAIGLTDDRFYTIRTIDDYGNQSYYISRTPLNEEWFTPQKVITKFGIADGIGTSITSRIIDVIYDPVTEQRIPVRQVLMSPSMASMDVVELEPVENSVKIIPIVEEVETDLDVKVQKVTAWTVKCSHCGGRLDIDQLKNTEAGTFIRCDYCGTNNGIRRLKE